MKVGDVTTIWMQQYDTHVPVRVAKLTTDKDGTDWTTIEVVRDHEPGFYKAGETIYVQGHDGRWFT